MKYRPIYRAILILLLFITATAPVVAGEQFKTGTAGHSEQSRICDDMTSEDCTLAASLGNCGQAVSALAPEKAVMHSPSASGTNLLNYRNTYLSIILDTLTPPPNASKA